MSLTQVRLKLVAPDDLVDQWGKIQEDGEFRGSDILSVLQRNKQAWFKDPDGKFRYHIQFDSQHFGFAPGEEMVVPEDVAWGLRNSSRVLVYSSDPLSSPMPPALTEIDRWVPGTSKPKVEEDLRAQVAKLEKELAESKKAQAEASPETEPEPVGAAPAAPKAKK